MEELVNDLEAEIERLATVRNAEVVAGCFVKKRKHCGYRKAEKRPQSRTRAKKMQFSRPCWNCMACEVAEKWFLAHVVTVGLFVLYTREAQWYASLVGRYIS